MESLTRPPAAWSAISAGVLRYRYQASGILVLLAFLALFIVSAPPRDFPSGAVLRIAPGSTAPEVANQLADARVIQHPTIFRMILRLTGESGRIRSGLYEFKESANLFVVAYRLVTGAYGLPPVRITFIEGATVRDIAGQVADAFPGITAEDFMRAGQSFEGYLFPDTYFFDPGADPALILSTLRSNFDTKIRTLAGVLEASGHTLPDIVIMASLIEKEARTAEDRRVIAGILWNRIRLGMPLQVDAVFGYIFNRDTYSPSFADLKVDSPYNTYTHTGLPPGPIDNPGLDALEAAAAPAKTPYLYYLTGKDGLMHYARTFTEHQANRQRYLR